MTWAAALFVVFAFLALVGWFGIPARVAEVIARSRSALADMRNRELDELDKEKRIQQHARRLLVLFVVVTLSAALALAAPLGIVALLDLAGIVDFDATMQIAVSWQFLVVATAIGFAAMALLRKRRT